MTTPIEDFNILQKKTKTHIHLKVDDAMEDCTGKLLYVWSSHTPDSRLWINLVRLSILLVVS